MDKLVSITPALLFKLFVCALQKFFKIRHVIYSESESGPMKILTCKKVIYFNIVFSRKTIRMWKENCYWFWSWNLYFIFQTTTSMTTCHYSAYPWVFFWLRKILKHQWYRTLELTSGGILALSFTEFPSTVRW